MTDKNQNDSVAESTTDTGDSLGLAGRMAKAFIHSPLSPLLFFVMLVMGILGLVFTPRQEDPQISVPMVDIFVQYSGASSEQVASLAIDPLQRIMSEIPGVKHIYSASSRGEGMVTVQFEVGEQLGPSIVKVHDKLQSNLDKIPPGVSMPLVKPKGIDDVPVVTLTLWSEEVDDGALRTLGLDLLQSLKQIPNSGQGFIVGGRSEQVRVEVLPERLSGYGLSLDQVANTIRTANSEKEAGSLESGNNHFTVYTGAFLHGAEDIARLVVSFQNGVPVYVRDVAKVFQDREETSQLVNYYTGPAYAGDEIADAVPAITVAIAKKEGANGVTVAESIIEKVEHLKGQLIPDNVNVSITRNYGETANDKVNELIIKLFVATIAVGLLVWVSLGFRPAMVVLFVIPVVILITVFSAWVLGYTIDRVSLFALIFSIGILVDDAIVVIENIYRRWLAKGEMDTETAVDAVREVGNPTILATFTVIAALLPMGFVSGMMGPYMEPIPALGSVAMIFSLIAAFIFTPWLAMRIRPSMAFLQRAEKREHEQNEKLERFFRGLILPLLNDRKRGWLTLIGIIVVFFAACAMFYTTAVTVKMLPYDNKPEYSVVVDMPEGTALPVTANLTARLAEQIRTIEEVTALQTYVGVAQPYDFNGMVRHYYLRQEPWQGEIHVQLLHKNDRDRSSHEIAVQTRDLLTAIAHKAGARITVVEMPPGPPVLQSIVAEIYGPDANTRRTVANVMTEAFEKAEGIADVDNYLQEPHEVWRFEVDTEKAVRRGISVDTINRNLAMAMGGYKLGDVKQGTVLDPTYIVLQVPLSIRAEVSRLSDLPIPAPDGSTVPLTELGRFSKNLQDPIVYHKDLRPVEYVVGDAVGRLAAPIYGMMEVEDILAEYQAPDGVALQSHYIGPPELTHQSAFEWTGEWTVTYETFRDMGAAFAVALILIYILVVWEFGNFMVPLIIMAPIPLTLIGIIPGHWMLDAEFTATSMIGFIALAGIIVRNSILLVDFSMHQVKAGVEVRDAVILSCKTRTRPILITAFALVAGSSVILFDPIFQGMAISLLFGVLVSTLLTLVVIPMGCITARGSLCPANGNGTNGCEIPGSGEAKAGKVKSGSVVETTKTVVVALVRDFINGCKYFVITLVNLPSVIYGQGRKLWLKRVDAANRAAAARKEVAKTQSRAKTVISSAPTPDTAPSESEQAVSSETEADDTASGTVAETATKPRPKAAIKKTVKKKATVRKQVKKKAVAEKKSAPKKTAPKKAAIKKRVVKKSAAKRSATKKSVSKKSVSKKSVKQAVSKKAVKSSAKSSAATETTPKAPSVKKKSGRRGIRLKPGLDSSEGGDNE